MRGSVYVCAAALTACVALACLLIGLKIIPWDLTGSRYVSWLPSFSVEVTRVRTPPPDQLDEMTRQMQQLFRPESPSPPAVADSEAPTPIPAPELTEAPQDSEETDTQFLQHAAQRHALLQRRRAALRDRARDRYLQQQQQRQRQQEHQQQHHQQQQQQHS